MPREAAKLATGLSWEGGGRRWPGQGHEYLECAAQWHDGLAAGQEWGGGDQAEGQGKQSWKNWEETQVIREYHK